MCGLLKASCLVWWLVKTLYPLAAAAAAAGAGSTHAAWLCTCGCALHLSCHAKLLAAPPAQLSSGPIKGERVTCGGCIRFRAQERVVEAAFLHQRYAPALADEADHAALVVATKHDLFNIGA